MLYVNSLFNSRKFVLWFRDLSLKELHTLTILFYLLAYFDEQFTCRSKTFDRMSINLAKFRTRNRVLETMNHRHCWLIERFRAKDVRSSRIDNDFVSFYSLIVTITSVNFTSLVTMKIKYNVKKRVWLEITETETWIFDLKSKYVYERSKCLEVNCASSLKSR